MGINAELRIFSLLLEINPQDRNAGPIRGHSFFEIDVGG
jgi:hypothetical protein